MYVFRALTTDAVLRCSHGTGQVQLGPGAKGFGIGTKPAVRAVDVLNQPVKGCKDCKVVLTVAFGQEPGLTIDGSPVLTEVAYGTTNAGTWQVVIPAAGAVAVGPWLDPAAPNGSSEASEPAAEDPPPAGQPLYVREWRSYRCPAEREYRPDVSPKRADGLPLSRGRDPAGKWLYVFTLAGRRPKFHGEYRAMGGTARRVVGPLRATADPPPPEWGAPLNLPPETPYGLLLTRMRLPRKALRWLEKVHSRWWNEQRVVAGRGEVWATDPLAVADELAARYAEHCDRLTAWTEPPGPPQYPLPQVKLGMELVVLFDRDSNDELKLEDELEGGREAVREYVGRYTDDAKGLGRLAESAGVELSRWLGHPLFVTLAAAHQVYPEADMPVFLDVYARCVARGLESFAGQRLIAELRAGKGAVPLDYLMPSGPSPAKVSAAVAKAAESVVKIWRAAALAAKVSDRGYRTELVLRPLAILFPTAGVAEYLPNGTVRYWVGSAARPVVVARAVWEQRPGWGARLAEAGGHLKEIAVALQVLNLGTAVWKVADDPAADRGWNLAGVGGSVGSILSDDTVRALIRARLLGRPAWGWLYLSDRTAARVGMLAAFVDTLLGVRDVYTALRNDDPTAAIAPAGRTVVNALVLSAAAEKAATIAPGGLLARLTARAGRLWSRFFRRIPVPVSRAARGIARVLRHPLVLIALVIIELLLAFRTRSALQQLAKNGPFGTNPGGGGTKPKWAARPTNEWPGHPDVVLDAFYRLVAAFEVTAGGGQTPWVRVTYGAVFQPAGRVEIEVLWGDGRREQLTITPGTGGKPSAPADWSAVSLPKGQGLEVRRTESMSGGPNAVKCRVRLDILGTGLLCVPGSNSWFELPLPSRATDTATGSSLDVEIERPSPNAAGDAP